MADIKDFEVTLEGAARVVVRRDDWVASKPWHADVVWPDGHVWKGWCQFFRTKKSIVSHAREALDSAGMFDVEIEFA